MDEGTSFEHGSSFEQGELSGNVRLGRLEAHYGELFTDVIEDGVITLEERARLDRMADALGLDRVRLRKLEEALSAVYESRQRVKIVDLSELADEEPRPSVQPIEAPTDARTLALQRRVTELEARVAELTKQLEEARSQVAVEIDLSGIEPAARAEDDIEALRRRLAHDARDVEALRALYRASDRAGDLDGQVCAAQALVFLGAADERESSTFSQHKTQGLVRPKTSLTQEAWRRLLYHPDEEVLVGEIFSAIAGAVLLGRIAALRRDKALPQIDPAHRLDPTTSTVQAVRCFAWGAAILGMNPPPLFVEPELDTLVQMIPAVPPLARLGKKALSGRSPLELAFLAGRHLAWYREERFLRLLVPQVADLEDLFLTAVYIGNPGLPLRPEVKRRVAPLAQAIEPLLEPQVIDRLRGHFLRFVEEGGRTNLQRWANAADGTAARAGLLLSGDLSAAQTMLALEDPDPARLAARMDDLLAFTTSVRYTQLRKQIGIGAAQS